MNRRARPFSFLALLALLIPLLACSPRPLFRFVRSLVAPPPIPSAGESSLVSVRSAAKSAGLPAIVARSLRARQDPGGNAPPPPWLAPRATAAAEAETPSMDRRASSRRAHGQLSKPAYLKAYLHGMSDTQLPPPA